MPRPKKSKKPVKVKFKTKAYIGNPTVRATNRIKELEAQNDSLKARIDSLEKAQTIKIHIDVK